MNIVFCSIYEFVEKTHSIITLNEIFRLPLFLEYGYRLQN